MCIKCTCILISPAHIEPILSSHYHWQSSQKCHWKILMGQAASMCHFNSCRYKKNKQKGNNFFDQ